MPKGSRLDSIQSQFDKSVNEYPFMGVDVVYDNEFIVCSAIDFKSIKLNPQKGLHVGDYHYWNPELSKFGNQTKYLEVRVDPENPYQIYALVNGNWITCGATKLNRFSASDSTSQFIEGLIALECQSKRNSISDLYREQISGLIKNLSQTKGRPSGGGSYVMSSFSEQAENDTEINEEERSTVFESIKGKPLVELEVGEWS